MERRFRVRLDELLDDAAVDPAVPRGMLPGWRVSWSPSSPA
jgi:hypothetical protein